MPKGVYERKKVGPVASGKAPVLLETEQAVCAAALKDGDTAESIVGELQPVDFYGTTTYKIFVGIQKLVEEGLAVNAISVSERAGLSRNEVDDLVDRANGITPSQLRTFISELKRVSDLRSVYNACINTSSSIGITTKVEEAVEGLEKGLYKMDRGGSQEAQDGGLVLDRVKDSLLAKAASGGGPEVSTGLRDLDKAIVSFSGPKVYVVAARPSMGKTALSSTIRRAILGQGLGVIEFNLEMGADEILERELAFQAKLNLRKVLSAKGIDQDELLRVQGLSGESLFQSRWFIDDRTYSIAGIRRKSRILAGRLSRSGVKVGCVIIDYLQLAGENGEGREQSVAAISRNCKLMAKELQCPVMVLSQLNRSCEYREDRRPQLSDLRESGSIEQDADVVGFIYREHMYDNTFPPEEAEFIIRKQRSGPIGTVRLSYNAKLVTFEDRKQVMNEQVQAQPAA